MALAMGKAVSDVAGERGREASARRFRVRRTHGKPGLVRQADLIRPVFRGMGLAPVR